MSMTDVATHFHKALQGLSDAHDAVYEAKAELRILEGERKGEEDKIRVAGLDGATAPERDAQLRIALAKVIDETVIETARKKLAEAERDLDVSKSLKRFLQTMANFEATLAGDSTSALTTLTAQEAF